jgi:integrase
MARTVRDAKLESRTARAALKPASKPYYRGIDAGLHLGYRKGKTGGVWVLRRYVGDQDYQVEKIGVADDTLDADGSTVLTFSQAQAIARDRFMKKGREAAGVPEKAGPFTVKDCIDEYVAWMKADGKTAADTRWRADALILPRLGKVECGKLSTKQITAWRDELAGAGPRLRTAKNRDQRFRESDEDEDPEEATRRRRASTNRVLTILKAALNRAWREKKIPSDEAWRAVKPYREADAARVRYLSVKEAQRLINAADADFRKLVQAAVMTGARFGELAALEAGDFNPDSGTVHIRKSKSGKARHVVLTDEGIELFKALAAGKGSRDRLLMKDNGTRWGKSHQSRPMAEACEGAKIDPPANFHCLRHTYASHTIMNGAPLMVVAKNLGHADTRMVEKHYGHMSESFVADAIRAAAPKFGFKADEKVVAI